MSTKCPECDLNISDKALSCPHCGYPLKAAMPKKLRQAGKHRRLPNGFGQISEIKNRNLRNPFRAMVTVGKTPNGRPICKPLKPESYFHTYNDAYAALAEYNKNPYDLAPSITVKELYEKWSGWYFDTLTSESSIRAIKSVWVYCNTVYGMRALDLRARHIKGCMEEGVALIKGEEHRPTAGIKTRIKSLFNLMLDYALEYELVDRNYARTFNIPSEITKESEDNARGHIPFTDEEMATLWENVGVKQYADVLLIQCYSGWRPQELGLIRLENVNLDDWTFIGGMKTTAGTNRLVPIHSRIRSLVAKRYEEAVELGSEYLINCSESNSRGLMLTYPKYQQRFTSIKNELHLNSQHRAHDGRTHFVTMAKKYGVDEYAIKYIVGHAISDITEKVYTKREVDWLKDEMEKIEQAVNME